MPPGRFGVGFPGVDPPGAGCFGFGIPMPVSTVPAGRPLSGLPGDRFGFCISASAFFLANAFNALVSAVPDEPVLGPAFLYLSANCCFILAASLADPRGDDPNFPFNGIMIVDHPSALRHSLTFHSCTYRHHELRDEAGALSHLPSCLR